MRKHNSGFCQECGRWRDTLHRDHIVPRWKGGPDTPDNVQNICANCHEDKTREDLVGLPPTRGISASLTGKKRKPFSDEHRANMRLAAAQRRWAVGRVAVSVPSVEDLLK